jgi:hypothetical protein
MARAGGRLRRSDRPDRRRKKMHGRDRAQAIVQISVAQSTTLDPLSRGVERNENTECARVEHSKSRIGAPETDSG